MVGEHVTQEDIAETVRETDDALLAFRDILIGLFAQYPVPEECWGFYRPQMEGHRGEAIGVYAGNAHRMAYYACDTGVPNELILAAYAILFL